MAILDAWQFAPAFPKELLKLSDAVARKAPPYGGQISAGRIVDNFEGAVTRTPIAAMLCAEVGAHLLDSDRQDIASLRLYLLIKSMELATAGYQATPHLLNACKQVRKTLEEPTSSRDGLGLIRYVSPANEHFGTFEASLKEASGRFKLHIESNEKEFDTPSATSKFADNIEAVASGRPTKLVPLTASPSPQTSIATSTFWEKAVSDEDIGTEAIESTFSLADEALGDPEAEYTLEAVVFVTPPSPSHSYRLGRGLHLQSQADRNHIPNAWNRLRPDEIHNLQLLIPQWISSEEHSLLGVIAGLAIATQKSIESACSIAISQAPVDSRWVLDLQGGRLLRYPNRPALRARAAEVNEREGIHGVTWLRPLADVQVLTLEPNLHQVLRAAAGEKPSADQLGNLWNKKSTPQAEFNRLCMGMPELARVTQGLLPNTTEQLIFNATEDSTFARMLLSTDDWARPAAASYASWTLAQANSIIAGLSCGINVQPGELAETNGLGSELDPIDALLQAEFAHAAQKVKDALELEPAHPDAWIEAHNNISGYMVAALLAGTGARPVNSVFEHRNDFDLEGARLFLDDKSFDLKENGRWGRIVPLPSVLVELMQFLYLPYLAWLQAQLASHGASSEEYTELADAISRILQGTANALTPMFFLLKRTNKLRIVEVSERGLSKFAVFSWSLPWNIFRHRMATRLRTLGCEEELIAAQMGHAETGADTYGPYSPRCWVDDEAGWLAALESCVGLLKIEPIRFRTPSFSPTALPSDFRRFFLAASFGSGARRKDRELVKTRAHLEAEEFLISKVKAHLNVKGAEGLKLDDKFPELLTDEQLNFLSSTDFWTPLGLEMLFTSKKTPRPNQLDWYEAYEEFRLRVSAGSFVPHQDRLRVRKPVRDRAVFPAGTMTAERTLKRLREELTQTFATTHPSHRSLKLKGLLVALDIALNSSVSDNSLLCMISASESSKLQLYKRNANVFVARPPDRTEPHSSHFSWVCVPARSVPCIADLMEAKGKEHKSEVLPEKILGFIRAAERELGLSPFSITDRKTLIRKVADIVNSANQLLLPGIVAGVRRGQVTSWSLNVQALARAVVCKRPVCAEALAGTPADGAGETWSSRSGFGFLAINQTIKGGKNDREMLAGIRNALTVFQEAVKDTANESPDREKAAATVKSLHAEQGRQTSPNIQLLTVWIIRLLTDKGAAGGWLRASSIKKYLSLIAPGFLDFGSELNLLEAGEEEIEEFYKRVLFRPVAVNARNQEPDLEGRRLDELSLLGRLREFHHFIEREYGAESPDWSTLGEGLTSSMVSAELILPIEYQHALLAICPLNAHLDRQSLMGGMLLVLGYRFGLRSAEAISMARNDWIEIKQAVVVLVSGKFKASKSNAGRRQVPLLGSLTDHEHAIVGRWFEYWASLGLPDVSAPMFPSSEDLKKPALVDGPRRRVVEVLRIATGSAGLTFHHARHSFACNVALRVLHPELLPQYPHLCADWLWGADSVRKQLLGVTRTTRRSPWAVSVVLGHAHPATSLGSYLHFIHDWANHRVIEKQPEKFRIAAKYKLPRCLDLDELAMSQMDHPVPVPPLLPSKTVPRKPEAIVRYLQLLSREIKPDRAGWLCGFDEADTEYLIEGLSPLRASYPMLGLNPGKPQLARLVSVPTSARWNALGKMLHGCSLPQPAGREAMWQIADARQILLWLPEHFELLSSMLASLQWNESFLNFYKPKTRAYTTGLLANERKWKLLSTHIPSTKENVQKSKHRSDHPDEEKRFQVEVGRYPTKSGLHFYNATDRIAVVPAPGIAPVGDRAELILLWIALNLGI
ncbi:MAG: hypothetical protein PSV40_09840 [Polaromonas sp.]|uniref:hypothetical protein n=1 Tax=Polaromonas sp. TaxID=1869339 RepID=UPI002487F879|nr:hypothetical protein [Polaromonas sp.]MDI1269385.1 hypothetical protein [Polaromonas sp.]